MYSVVLMAALSASPDVPQALLCPVSPSRYGSGFWSKKNFFDCCAPARYGWVNCWNKGFGAYPGGGRGFSGSCALSYGTFFNPGPCACGPCGSGGYSTGASCGTKGCGICGYGWGLGHQPAYYTSVIGCPPRVSAPPYAHYTQCNPCCTNGHFAFDSGLIGHSHGVGYAGFGAFGNFGLYGAVPMSHPPTTADLPPFPRNWEYVPPSTNSTTMPPIPKGTVPPVPPKLGPSPMTIPPMVPAKDAPDGPPDSLLPKAPKFPATPDAPKKDAPKLPEKLGALKPESATVVLSVPAGSIVKVEGHALKATGRERSFRTPALEVGREFTYSVEATMIVDGEEVVETQNVTVSAGQTSRASFEKLFAKAEAMGSIATVGGRK